jgi:methylase of polypeptide subunit release factors
MTTTAAQDFAGLRIQYDDRVLAPRPWTVAQAEWAADLIRTAPPGRVLELCAGAGQIGLLAVHLAHRSLVCVDANPAACEFIRRNATAAAINVDVREGPLASALEADETFAVIIADPPWVATADVQRFADDPVGAIDGGADGLRLVRQCLEVIAVHLVLAGSAVLQVGPDQVDATEALVSGTTGLRVIQVRRFPRGALVQIDRVSF